MSLKPKEYKNRLIDDKIKKYLGIFGAILIEGPKWCGKTWTALNNSNSVTYLTEKSVRNLALIDPKYIFLKELPQTIDEWQIVPEIWDSVRNECDKVTTKGNFILTGSTSLRKEEREGKIFHTGNGRIASIRMYPMSLYESGDSQGNVSISEMKQGHIKEGLVKTCDLRYLANLIVRGGWPGNLDEKDGSIIPTAYIDSVVEKDIHERSDQKRNKKKMLQLIRSLSRNESTLANDTTILKDIADYENEQEKIKSIQSMNDYLSVLDDLFLTNNQEAFSINYRSSARIGKNVKRHLIDPSLTCAALNLNEDKLMKDHETFGLMFESLAYRDLKIYMNYLDGEVYHFRDNSSGDEVDCILEFKDGQYAAIEIKLSEVSIEEGKRSLLRFYEAAKIKPKFMAIIMGYYNAVIKDKETGIYLLPLTSLKP